MAYLPLSTANLPAPVIDPAKDMEPRDYFETFLYTGNGGGLQVGDVIKKLADTYPISQSLRFEDGDSALLKWSNANKGTPTDASKFTFSAWVKRGNLGISSMILGSGTGANNDVIWFHTDDKVRLEGRRGGTSVHNVVTDMAFKDTSAWYHIVVSYDADQVSASDRITIYVNGVAQSVTTNNEVDSGRASEFSETDRAVFVGKGQYGSSGTTAYYDGYMAELHFIDGTAYDATDFGAFDGGGRWYPITPSVTYGTNGWYLDFADSADLGNNANSTDGSNDFDTVTNLASTDVVIDTPTNSICTLDANSGVLSGGSVLSEGNLYFGDTASSGASWYKGTQQVKSGKWYFEGLNVAHINGLYLGWQQYDGTPVVGVTQTGTAVYMQSGYSTILYTDQSSQNNSISGSPSTNTTGDVYQVAIDVDTGKVWFGVNNTWAGDPAAGTGYAAILSDSTKGVRPLLGAIGGGSYQYIHLNFGQDSTFSGSKTAGDSADGNGVGDFQYAPPTGFLALAENNITVDDQNLESPDLVWIKNRSAADSHQLYDSVRGVQRVMKSDPATGEPEADAPNGLLDFNKNGFTIGSQNEVNTSGEDYVAWCWKANGTGTSITTGSIDETNPTIASTVSANTTSGFSIVTFSGDNSGGTVAHGIGSAPDFIIFMQTDSTAGGDHIVYHSASGATKNLRLNNTDLQRTDSTFFSDTEPTSSVFTVNGTRFPTGRDYLAYCFSEVEGFSKFGSYSGNNSTDGPFIYLGFRPALFVVKCTNTTGSWYAYHAPALNYNPMGIQGQPLGWDLAGTDTTADTSWYVDALSNGVKIRNNSNFDNASNSFVYMAWAKNPFKYSNAR